MALYHNKLEQTILGSKLSLSQIRERIGLYVDYFIFTMYIYIFKFLKIRLSLSSRKLHFRYGDTLGPGDVYVDFR